MFSTINSQSGRFLPKAKQHEIQFIEFSKSYQHFVKKITLLTLKKLLGRSSLKTIQHEFLLCFMKF